MKIPSVVYQVLYQKLKIQVEKVFYPHKPPANGINSPDLWDLGKDLFNKEFSLAEKANRNSERFDPEFSKDYWVGTCSINPNYFYRLHIQYKTEISIIAKVDDMKLFYAFQFIGIFSLNNLSLRTKLMRQYAQFLKNYSKEIKLELERQKNGYSTVYDDTLSALGLEENQGKQFEKNEITESSLVTVGERHIAPNSLKRKEFLSSIYSPLLLGRKFWFYIHSVNKFKKSNKSLGEKYSDANEASWKLLKLLLEFPNKDGLDLNVRLTNVKENRGHQDYSGKTAFLMSIEGSIVVNCRTDQNRPLYLIIQISDGDIYIGQYLNRRNSGRVVSGAFVIQPAEETDNLPKSYEIPKLATREEVYLEDIHGVDRRILQYLHDETLNFRRTTTKTKGTLESLEDFLRTHYSYPP